MAGNFSNTKKDCLGNIKNSGETFLSILSNCVGGNSWYTKNDCLDVMQSDSKALHCYKEVCG